MTEKILEVEKLNCSFKGDKETLHVLRGVSFSLCKGETLGIVGESGCGKSTLGRVITGRISHAEGVIKLRGVNLLELKEKSRHNYRKHIQMVFQNPTSSFNPRMTIWEYLCEPLINHENMSKNEASLLAKNALIEVGLSDEFLIRYPHQLSGGQLQRVAIARALIISPDILVCDEATSGLDVSVQENIIKMLVQVQRQHKVSTIFIGHDLALVRSVSHRIAVMYLGEIIEVLDSKTIVDSALHPYTRALINSVIDVHCNQDAELNTLTGEPASMLKLPQGCTFSSRCEFCGEICTKTPPEVAHISSVHSVMCHKYSKASTHLYTKFV